ncbi:MAG: hypothetical protein PHR35_20310 [Kiritimatiellae bacterium]|nr:hypothetical protein [Kiritimatiellia bacterium]
MSAKRRKPKVSIVPKSAKGQSIKVKLKGSITYEGDIVQPVPLSSPRRWSTAARL